MFSIFMPGIFYSEDEEIKTEKQKRFAGKIKCLQAVYFYSFYLFINSAAAAAHCAFTGIIWYG